MKKLVLALFAAAAMIFGLAGCSGDLHDSKAFTGYTDGFSQDPAYGGTWENTVTEDSATQCHYSFTVSSAMASNGVMIGIKGPHTAWTNRYEVAAGDYTLNTDIATQTTEPSPRGLLKGLTEGRTVTVTATYSNGKVTLKATSN